MRDVNAQFAGWLKEERQRTGMSQEKLAAALRGRGMSITQSQIAKIERGERGVELGLAVEVTAILGATVDTVLGLRAAGGEEEQSLRKMLARRETFIRSLVTLASCELESDTP